MPLNVRWRLYSIIAEIVGSSISQSNKSLVGEAGKMLARAVLSCAGFEEDVNFRSELKGGSGSDTDFVIPNVRDRDLENVRVFISVQFSSNDRTRMAASEFYNRGEHFRQQEMEWTPNA